MSKKRRHIKLNQYRKVPPARAVDIASRLAALRLVGALFPTASDRPSPPPPSG